MPPLSDAFDSGLYRRAVGVTSAQAGKTECVMDVIGAAADQRPAPLLYVGPSADFNRDQFEPRLMEMFESAESLKGRVTGKKLLKRVNGIRLRLASAHSSTQLKSDPAAAAYLDEYDEMMSNIKGQGDPLGLVEARGFTHPSFSTLITSTPGEGLIETEIDEVSGLEFWAVGEVEQIASPIWRLFQEGTRHHWAVPCPHCKEYFIPMMKHLDWPKGATPIEARRSAVLVCPSNGCVIEDDRLGDNRRKMNSKGVMIAPGQTIKQAKKGKKNPDNSTYSQWASGLMTPFVTWGQRAEALVSARMSGESDKEQTAVNAGFGELFSEMMRGDLPGWKELLKHKAGHKKLQVPLGGLVLVMGVDVQTNGLYYTTKAYGGRGTSWTIDYGFLNGLTNEDQVWEDLAILMQTPIQGIHVSSVLIDSGFRPDKKEAGSVHKVYDFCRKWSFLCVPTKGRASLSGKPAQFSEIEVTPTGKRRPFTIKLLHVDTDFFKSLVHTRIKTPLDAPGAFFLHDDADEEYAKQVLSEARVITAGTTKPKWVKNRNDNHWLDCEALAAAGGYLKNVHALPEGAQRTFGDMPDQDPEDEATVPAPEQVQKDLKSRFRRRKRK
jgi:phage terminase large subunit GpA-like protein